MSPLAVLKGAGWQLVFERSDDRIAHRIEADTASGAKALLESVEGPASTWWPPSPPLQNLHLESRGEGQVALLVGMAGRSHWSASVEIDPSGQTATFDFACRASAEPQWLGNRYRIGWQLPVDWAAGTLRLGQYDVALRALEPAPPRIDFDGQIEIAAWPAGGRWPQTVRWRYAMQVWRPGESPRTGASDKPGC